MSPTKVHPFLPFETAIRLIEIALSCALLQRGAEHLSRDWQIFLPQMGLALVLLSGVASGPAIFGLWIMGLVQLHRYCGPYNGGADKMAMLILTCLCVVKLSPDRVWAEMALGYLSIQLMLSYFMSGWVKLRNPQWRNGQALSDVFSFSVYPATEALRGWATRRAMMLAGSWGVIGLEVLFPLALFRIDFLIAALLATSLFHLGNAVVFGLNRFFWIWISAYPALIWFQGRVV